MNLAIVLCHNKNATGNEAQIAFLRSRLSEVRVLHVDEFGVPILDEQTGLPNDILVGYTLNGLPISHVARVFQIVPFGVTPPANLYEVDSHKVFYGVGDSDKVKDHPRFFNWGLKRATDYGADFVLFLDDYLAFDVVDAKVKLIPLANPDDGTVLTESAWGRIGSLKLLKEVGQLDERKKLGAAFVDLKQRITAKGLKHG